MEALDGNAIAGALHTAFGDEMTTARSTCATCGSTQEVAALRVYLRAPGTVARCPECGQVRLVLIEARGVVCVDLRGCSSLGPVR
jgi:Family of unknown function (DUF6510)